MTLQNMIEIVKQQFPDKMETQIRIDLNAALMLYSEETRLPYENVLVTESDSLLRVDHAVLSATNGWTSLPDTVRDIVTVTALDSNNNVVDQPEYHIEYVGRRFAILDYNNLLYRGDGFPPRIASLSFGCSTVPVALAVDTDAPPYPEAFHQALVDHVLAKYYGYKGVLQQSGWFRSSYQASVASGKRYFNRNMH